MFTSASQSVFFRR